MAYLGMDDEQVTQLANELKNGASEIERVLQKITNQLHNTKWEGPDATKFRSDWDGNHTSQLRRVVEALNQAAQDARKNVTDQQTASRS